MGVRSRTHTPPAPRYTSQPQPVASWFGDLASHEWGKIVVGLFGIVIAVTVWLAGAKFSADGILRGVNFVLWFFGVHWGFIIPPHYALYCLIAPIPVGISYTEFTHAPRHYDADLGVQAWRPAGAIFVWFVVLGIDFATNVGGVTVQHADTPLWWHQLTASFPTLAILVSVMTAGPELLLRSMTRYIRSAW